MKSVKALYWLAGLGILLLLGACGSGDDGSGTGTMQVALTDAADHNFSEVVITIEEVRAVSAGDEMMPEEKLPLIVAFDPPKTVDVLELAYVQDVLGEAVLPAGAYNQLRLVLAENTDPAAPFNYVVLADDPQQLAVPIDTPSAHRSGLKVVGRVDLGEDQTASVSLDFDPSRAIVHSGTANRWQFKPTGIRMVQTEEALQTYGALAGQVSFEVHDGDLVTPHPVVNAMVTAIPEDDTAEAASGLVDPEDGTFRLLLPPGGYELRITAEGYTDYTTLPDVFDVFEGEDTEAGTLLLSPFATF